MIKFDTNFILIYGAGIMSYIECVPLIEQLDHSEKLKLAQWLIQTIAQEEGVYANETEFVSKNSVIMAQIELSKQTHQNQQGYKPSAEELKVEEK
jgi:hypothetical protein